MGYSLFRERINHSKDYESCTMQIAVKDPGNAGIGMTICFVHSEGLIEANPRVA